MAKRKKTKECKILRRCTCGCGRLCNGHDVVRVGCAIDFVKKLGYSVEYFVWEKPLHPWELKKIMEYENE